MSEQLVGRGFAFRRDVGEGGRGKREKEGERTRGNQTEREEGGEDRLSSSSCEHGRRDSYTLEVPICRIHKDKTKRLCSREPEITWGREPIWDDRIRVSVRARREAFTLRSPFLTMPHQAHQIERREVGECRGELGADFSSFWPPRLPRNSFEANFSRQY